MAYPESIDKFVDKLNKLDNNTYVIEEEVQITNDVYEGELEHDNVSLSSINVYTGSKLTGNKVENVIVSTPSLTPWKTHIKIFSDVSPVYITYQTTGDTVEAEDVNKVQDSIVNTQKEVDRYKTSNDNRVSNDEVRLTNVENNKAEKTYVDTELNKRYTKDETYTKTETDQRIQMVIDAAPEALDTLKEIANALNNDPNFAATITTQLSKKVDKVDGKQLSTEDYTTTEKSKLAGIEDGANKYIHPAIHPGSMITEDISHRWTTDTEKTNWNDANSKKHTHNNLSILQNITQALIDSWNTVSDKSDKGHKHSKSDITDFPTSMPANGGTSSFLGNAVNVHDYNTLNPIPIATSQGCITPIKADSTANSPWVNTTSGFLIQSNPDSGSSGSYHILIFRSGGDGWAYRSWYQGTWSSWKIWSTFDGNYNNLSNKPSIPTKVSQLTNDSNFVTQTELGNAGYGDMMKSAYDKDNDGVIDKAASLNRIDITGQTVDLNGVTLSDGTMNKYYINKTNGGSANISNIPVLDTSFILDVELIRYVSEGDYIAKQTFTSGPSKNTYERFYTSGTWSSWSTVLTSTKKCTWNDLKGV